MKIKDKVNPANNILGTAAFLLYGTKRVGRLLYAATWSMVSAPRGDVMEEERITTSERGFFRVLVVNEKEVGRRLVTALLESPSKMLA